MSETAIKVFKELQNEDFRILQIIETAMSKREYVPQQQITKYAKLPTDRINFTLSKLNKLGLIYQMKGAYIGHTLNYAGYDCLAINALVKAGIIQAFGQKIGVGKEADVYTALNPQNNEIAVKFHRLGRISFRQTRRKRSYTPQHANWLFQSRIAAEKEYQALTLVYQHGVAVPKPISKNRHVIAMGIIEGDELSKYKEIKNPKKILKEILRNIRKTYLKAKIIHGDISEYNIILKPDSHILIIDWPQYEKADHPNAEELLQRDIKNVLTFFSRRFKAKVSPKEACDYITGKARSLLI